MEKWQYEMLQDQLSIKAENNPFLIENERCKNERL